MTEGLPLRSVLAIFVGCAFFFGVVVLAVGLSDPTQTVVPCSLDKSKLCPQREACQVCTICSPQDDNCCCLHNDRCSCADDINRAEGGCCDEE